MKIFAFDKRRVATVAGTLLVAFTTGHLMQNGTGLSRYLPKRAEVAALPSVTINIMPIESDTIVDMRGQRTSLPRLDDSVRRMSRPAAPEISPVSSATTSREARTAHKVASVYTVTSDANPDLSALPRDCSADIVASERPAAMVALNIVAPCNRTARATINHNGLVFSVVTDKDGVSETLIPAMAEDAKFSATFDDGTRAQTLIQVPESTHYDRVALQWSGLTGFELHAFEFGADYDDAGHVWRGAPRDPSFALGARGGFLTRLGQEDGLRAAYAEVYTFPSSQSDRDGTVRLVFETEVIAATCGREVAGQTLQRLGGGELVVSNVALSIPACDAVGEYLVLKNLLPDLKIAAN